MSTDTRQRTTAALIALDDLLPSPTNIRSRLTDIEPLARSIRAVGILQPLVVVPKGSRFEIKCGHRRRAASQMAGLRAVPCMVRHHNRTDETALMIAENLQRAELDPLDAARAFARLRETHAMAEVVAITGFSAATISARIGLLALPKQAQEMVSDGSLSLGDARNLARELKKSRTGSARIERATKKQGHFAAAHPLAAAVEARCTHGDTDRRLLGPGCGQCWEQVIREDALGVTSLTSGPLPPQHVDVASFDETAVQRVIDGGTPDGLGVAERTEIIRRLAARGLSDGSVAERIAVDVRSVQRIRARHGIAPGVPPFNPAHRRTGKTPA